jgi:hypothetical protein
MVREGLVRAKGRLDLDSYGTQPLAEKVKPTQEKSNIDYTKLLEKYHLQEDETRSSARKIVTDVLKPSEINYFLGFVLAEKTSQKKLGRFITDLVANSYYKGYRRFHLDLFDSRLNNLFYNRRLPDIEVILNGSSGFSFGVVAISSSFSAHSFGSCSGSNAKGSIFTAEHFEDRPGIGAESCVFRTSNKDTLDFLKRSVPRYQQNELALLASNGRELERIAHW